MRRRKKASRTKRQKTTNSLFKWIASLFAILIVLAAGSSLLNNFNGYPANFCANSISCIKDLSGKFEEGQTSGVFLGNSISVPKMLAQIKEPSAVLGETTKNKKIYIDLSAQRLFAKEDDKVVYEFPISSGKWAETPTGTFNIWAKLRYTRMSGGDPSIGTYYNLPNVPFVMYFYNSSISKARGFAIHGAYWHNNFGRPMSHGCVNMRIEDVGKLYAWANPQASENTTYATADNPGTEVIIYGETPKE